MLLTKLLLIAIVAITVAQAQSLTGWFLIAVPLIYLIWRLEPRKRRKSTLRCTQRSSRRAS